VAARWAGWRAAGALALVSALAGRAAADEGPLTLSGYVKNYSIVFRLAEPLDAGGAAQPLLAQSDTELRLSLTYSPSTSVTLLAAYDISPRIQDPFFFRPSAFAVSVSTGNYRVADFRSPLVPGPDSPAGSFGLYQNLDRLSVTFKTGFGDIIVGRQPVAWGSGKVTNPTDIIAPFSFYDLDKEERLGVDAARMRIPLSDLSQIDVGYVFGKSFRFDLSAFFLRGQFHLFKTDVSLLGLGFQNDFLIGLDVARSVGGSGVWLEAAYVLPGALASAPAKPANYGRLTAGIDRSLSAKVYGFVEYHFNSAGSSEPSSYAGLFTTPAYTRGSVYLMGRHYLSVGTTYQASPLIPVTGLVIWNANDGSFALSPRADYNVSQNMYLGGGVYLGLGRRPVSPLFGGTAPPELRSEFGSYPDFLYLSFRFYF
jgi:hypothetical protein